MNLLGYVQDRGEWFLIGAWTTLKQLITEEAYPSVITVHEK